jgi:prophage tail gpP-like protein
MTKTGEFRDKGVSHIAQQLLKPHGIGWKEYGPVNNRPFPRVNIAPGESVWNTIDMLVRQRGGWLGSDVDGSMHIRTQWDAIGDALIEGVNILEGRETMTISQGGGGDVDGKGVDVTDTQKSGNNKEWGAKVAHDPSGQADKTIDLKLGNRGVHAPVRTIAEHPGGKEDAKDRATKEADKRGAESLVVQIVVLGWLKPSGGLWKPGDKIHIKSPMLIIDEMMDLTSATFTQDSKSGTRTTLEFKRGEAGEGDVPGKDVDVTDKSSASSHDPSLDS